MRKNLTVVGYFHHPSLFLSGRNQSVMAFQPRRGDIFIAETAERIRGLACNFASGIVSPDRILADAKFMTNRCGCINDQSASILYYSTLSGL
jgi:hypothetical protein